MQKLSHPQVVRTMLGAALTSGCLLIGAPACGQSGGGYDLTWSTIDTGGETFSTSGPYSLGATAGQPDAGILAGDPYILQGGFWLGGSIPNPVDIAALGAVARGGSIHITWQTSFEVNHAGFHVQRSTRLDGDWERLTERLIEPPGPYEFVDAAAKPEVTYYYRLEALSRAGEVQYFGPVSARISAAPSPLVYRNHLARSNPNPFNPGQGSATLPFSLAAPGRVSFRIYDSAGRLVRALLAERRESGDHVATWDGRNDRGETVGSGVYFYHLDAESFTATQALTLLR